MSSTRGAIDRPITYQGAWNSALTYHPRMVVTYLNTTYMCVARNTNSQPSILSTTPWLPMGTSGSVVQSTVDFGLPTTAGRSQGDFHYNKTDKKEYVLVGTSPVQFAGDTFSTSAPDIATEGVTEFGAKTWVIAGGSGSGPRIDNGFATDSGHGNTAFVYTAPGPVTVAAKSLLGGYSSQNATVIYLGCNLTNTAGVQWDEVSGLRVHTTTGDVVLPNPTGCPPCVNRGFVDPAAWRSLRISWDPVWKEVTLALGGVQIGTWFLDAYTINDGGYAGFTVSVSQGQDGIDDFFVYNGVDPVWTPVWVDPGSVPTSVVTTKGDLLVGTGPAAITRLGVGTNTYVLTADSTQPTGIKWAVLPVSGITVQDENTTIASGATQLDFQGAGVTAAAGTGEVVVTVPGPAGVIGAKGDLIVGTGPTSIALLPVGTDTWVLTADSTQPSGVKWALASAGSSGITVQGQNVTVGSGVTQIDFQGAGVSVAAGTGEIVVTIAGSSADTTAMHYKGAWGAATAYAVGDVVSKLYQLYVATLSSTGSDPAAVPGAVITETAGTGMTPNGFWGMYTIAQQFTLTSPVSVDSLSYLCRTTSTANGNMKIGVATALGATENLVTWLNIGGVEVSTNLTPAGDPALGTSAMRTGAMGGRVTIPAGTYYFVCKGTSGVGAYRPSINNITGIGLMNITLPNNGIYTASAANGAYTNQVSTTAVQFQLGTGSVGTWAKIASVQPSNVVAKSAAYAMDPMDAVVLATGTFTVTWPPVATAVIGARYAVKNMSTGTITVQGASGTFDGAANKTLAVANSSVTAVTDGTNWFEV